MLHFRRRYLAVLVRYEVVDILLVKFVGVVGLHCVEQVVHVVNLSAEQHFHRVEPRHLCAVVDDGAQRIDCLCCQHHSIDIRLKQVGLPGAQCLSNHLRLIQPAHNVVCGTLPVVDGAFGTVGACQRVENAYNQPHRPKNNAITAAYPTAAFILVDKFNRFITFAI